VRLEVEVQFVPYDARLDPDPAFFPIEFQYTCEIFGDIHYDALPYDLSCQGGTGRAGYKGYILLMGVGYELFQVIDGPGDGDGQGHFSIRGRIGGI